MLGKTHMAAGVATSLILFQPSNLPTLVLGTGIAAFGAVLSDIDVETSKSHKNVDKIVVAAVIAVLMVVVIDFFFHVGIYNKLMSNSNVARVLIGGLLFIAVCAFGKEQPHRSFMHSILAWVILSFLMFIISPTFMPYFVVSFGSHLVLDLLNYKKVRLLYPIKGGFCLKLCYADGLVNNILLVIGVVLALAEFVGLLLKILF